MSVRIHQVLTSLAIDRGGMTRNVLTRARLMAEHYDQTVRVLVFNFVIDWDATCAEYRRLGFVDDRVELVSMFDELAPCPRPEADTRVEHPLDEDGFHVVPDDNEGHFRVLDGDRLVRRKLYASAGMIAHIEHFNEDERLIAVDHFDEHGLLRRSDLRDIGSGVITRNTYFDARGERFAETDYDPVTRDSIAMRLYDREGKVTATHPDEASLQLEWLRSHADRYERSLFHSDWWRADRVLARLDHPGAAKVMTLHTNHLRSPYRYGAAVRARSAVELSLLDRFDAVVFLSDRQRTDISLQYGPRETFSVVNNFAPITPAAHGVERDPMLAVGVGRYHQLKGWEAAITAMEQVVSLVPAARLELWGFGPERERLAAQIRDLGLEDNVRLRGITHDPKGVFASAAFSVLTSPAEGFPLASLESMAVGTPVVAFNANYGLAEQIEDGVDGILVEPGDTSALAHSMVEMFRDTEKREALGRRAPSIVNRLSVDAYVAAWEDVHLRASARCEHRETIDRAQVTIDGSVPVEDGVSLSGSIRVAGTPSEVSLSLCIRPPDPGAHRLIGFGRTPLSASGTGSFSVLIPADQLETLTHAAPFDMAVSAGSSCVFAEKDTVALGPIEVETRIDRFGRLHRRPGPTSSARSRIRRIATAVRRRAGR